MPWGAAVGAIAGGLIAANASDNASDTAAAGSAGAIGEQRRQFNTVRQDTMPYREVGQGALFRLADIFGLQRPAGSAEELKELSTLQGLKRQSEGEFVVDRDAFSRAFQEYFAARNQAPGPSETPGVAQFGGTFEQMLAQAPQALKDQYLNKPGFTPAQAERLAFLESRINSQQNRAATNASGGSAMDEILKASPGYQFRLQQGQQALERNQSKYRFTPRAAKEMTRYSQGVASDEFGRYLESQFRLAGLGGNAVNTSATAGSNAANQIGNASMSGAAIGANAQMAGAAGVNNAIQGGLSNYYTLQSYNQNRPQSTPFYGVGNSPY